MSVRDRLQIYLVTFNRKSKLQDTLVAILDEKSPIKDFDITILDNASTDGSSELIDLFCEQHSNVIHIRHKFNIGGNANIVRAYELAASCGKEYCWVLCDDDKYDFSNWAEVEERINAKDDVICVCDYVFEDGNKNRKDNPALQIFQLTFVPAGIYKVSNITNDVLINMYDAIIMMFQQVCIAIKCINDKKKIYVLSKPIVFNGLHFQDRVDDKSLSYFRGANEKWLLERKINTNWIVGFTEITSLIKNRNLQLEAIEASISYKDIFNCWRDFYNYMENNISLDNFNYFYEIYKNLAPIRQKILRNKYKLKLHRFISKVGFAYNPSLIEILKDFKDGIFSIKPSYNRKHRVLTILGIKFKSRRRVKTRMGVERERERVIFLSDYRRIKVA